MLLLHYTTSFGAYPLWHLPCTCEFGYRYAVHESFLLCTIQIHFGLQETHFLAVFWVLMLLCSPFL